tara:strand:+ start:11 stop:553 length:543 start_codon:yes stop_codon:yes gene_type:complete
MIRLAKIIDLPYIVSLSNKESLCLGFIPKMAYESAITGIKKGKRWSDTCNDKLFVCEENNDLVGFVMFSYGSIAKCNQICIQQDARLITRGKALLSAGITHGNLIGIEDFGCGCADDLPSNFFWSQMGWVKVGERRGISRKNTWIETSKRKINLYRYQTNSLFINNFGMILPKENQHIAL